MNSIDDLNIHMNLFEHYGDKNIPLENNITRVFARILNDNVYIFERFIKKIQEKLKQEHKNINLGKVKIENDIQRHLGNDMALYKIKKEYIVDIQENVEDISQELDLNDYESIVGVSLTAEIPIKEKNAKKNNQDIKDDDINRIPDIIIKKFNKTLIIVEVKKTKENCEEQLTEQIDKICKREAERLREKSVIVFLEWENIVDILEDYKNKSEIKDVIVNDFYTYLMWNFPNWFPVKSLSECNNEELYTKRIYRLVHNICKISQRKDDKFDCEKNDKNVLRTKKWGWTNRILIEKEKENLAIKIWAGDSKDKNQKLMKKSKEFKFVTEPKYSDLYLNINNESLFVEVGKVKPYIKLSDTFR